MDIPGYIITAIAGIVGVAVAWGTMQTHLKINTKDIESVMDKMDGKVSKLECAVKHDNVTSSLSKVGQVVEKQEITTRRLYNFAVYQMTTKDGMSLSEAQDVLENGNG